VAINEKARNIISVIAICILLLLASLSYIRSNEEAKLGYKDTITRLQEENIKIAEQLTISKRAVNTIATELGNATERVGSISNGIGESIDAIDASIRITAELFEFIDVVGRAIEEHDNGIPP